MAIYADSNHVEASLLMNSLASQSKRNTPDSLTICFVSLHAYPAIQEEAKGVFGGTETRAITFARGMARLTNHKILFLTRHPQLRKPTEIDGIRFLPWRDYWTELRASVSRHLEFNRTPLRLSFKSWNGHLLWQIPLLLLWYPYMLLKRGHVYSNQALKSSPADLYFCFGVNSASAIAIEYAKQADKKSVLFLGSDADLDERYQPDSSWRNAYGERASLCYQQLQQANHVIVQNQRQQEWLQQRFGREGILIPNPIDRDQFHCDDHQKNSPELFYERYMLWVGRADDFHKRAPVMLEIARQMPEINFVMVMNPKDITVEERIKQNQPRNLQILSKWPFRLMNKLFENATGVISTSAAEHEGFPNLFLQAAIFQVPILSLEVAEAFLRRKQAGRCSQGDLKELMLMIRQLWQNQTLNGVNTQYASQLVESEHSLKTCIEQLLKVVDPNSPIMIDSDPKLPQQS